jgi:hypothetical protein
MNQQTPSRPLARTLLLAAATLIAQPVSAQTASNVRVFKALDSKNVDTKTCLATDAPLGGYVLSPCKTDPSQHFTFEGGTIVQNGLCLLVLTDANDAWTVGRRVSKHPCNSNTGGVSMIWQITDKKLIAAQSPHSNFCLTANSSKGPGLFLGDCSKPDTLTHWDIVDPSKIH